jgi:hypothetical protein
MGTWSASLFGSDIACDVRADYGVYLRWGMTGRQATKQVLEDWADELMDTTQDGPVVWLALAVTQWKFGRLEPRVKAKALRIIREGADVEAFPPELRKRRRGVLEKVRAQLESPQPPEKRVRVTKPAEPLKKIERLWKPGQVVAFRRGSGRLVLLRTEVVFKDEYIGQIPHFVVLNWEGARLPSPERICKLRATEYVVGVYPNKKGEPVPWDRVERLDLVRDVTGIIVGDRDGVFCEIGFDDCCWNELDARLDEEFDALPVKRT